MPIDRAYESSDETGEWMVSVEWTRLLGADGHVGTIVRESWTTTITVCTKHVSMLKAYLRTAPERTARDGSSPQHYLEEPQS